MDKSKKEKINTESYLLKMTKNDRKMLNELSVVSGENLATVIRKSIRFYYAFRIAKTEKL